MNKEFTVHLPKLGESITSATIIQWFKKPGDFVKLDEPLLEVSTDKVNSEIPSPVSGILKLMTAEVNQELDVGSSLCVISVEGLAHQQNSTKNSSLDSGIIHQEVAKEAKNEFLSPAVINLAQNLGVAFEDLKKIQGTGEGGRVTKRDVEHFSALPTKNTPTAVKPACSGQAPQELPIIKGQRIKMDPMRKAIAENMVKSFYTAPHASLIETLDVTSILAWIDKNKTKFMEEHGVKISLTAFIALACAKALKAFPLLNSQVQGDEIILKEHVNLGLAVSVGTGLLVPVIARCEDFTLAQMAKEISNKALRAREGKLLPVEVKEGSFTLTNFGMGGVQIGMPIIRFPEVAIVAVGTINKACVPLDDVSIGIRSIVTMTLTFDHRVVDGLYGCGFVNAMKMALETLTQ